MNTLNNIHALIDIDTEEAKEAIIRLSKLMRHILYDSEVEMIPLKKEIEFITNYIALMKLRFTEKVKIDFIFSSQLPDKSIPPLLITSFLENAFKHGISYNNISFVNISIQTFVNTMQIEISNSKHQVDRNGEDSGIGITNTRKRLDLLFGDDYTLDIVDEKEIFTVNLTIPV